MRHLHHIALMLLIALSAFLSSCGDDYQGDIDKLNGQYTSIDKRVSTLETQVGSMNTQLTQLSVLATAVEQGFYITQVKTISDGYELTLSNGRVIILQKGPDNRLTPMPAVSMTQIEGFYYWTLNGTLLTDNGGNPIRSTVKAPIVKYDYTKLQWMVSIDGGVTFQDVNVATSLIINDEVLMQVINSYVREHSTTIISREMLFQIISTYIQQNYVQLFSVELLDKVVATHIREHYTRIFSYQLLEKIFSQYNFSYITRNIRVEEIVNAILTFIREHQEIFLDNEVLFEIVSSYMEVNKTTIFTDALLLDVINNFMENNTNFIDVELLTQVVGNYIDQHQDELFTTETVQKLLLDYVSKYYTEIFSQDILLRLVSTYIRQNQTTIFNKTLIREVLNNYVQNNYNTIIKQETITEIINNYLKKNSTTVFNRDVLIDVISTYFEKSYSLFIDRTVISKAVNDYIEKHQTTIISVDVIRHIVNNYLEQYYTEVFSRDMITQVVNNYFENNMKVITEHISQGSAIVRDVTVSDDLCRVYLNGGRSVDLIVYDAKARLRDRVQSIVVLPQSNGRIEYVPWHNEISANYLVSPASMASVIANKYRYGEVTVELVITDGNGSLETIDASSCYAYDDVLSVSARVSSTIGSVALHIKENKTGGTDIMTEFTAVDNAGAPQGYLRCPDNHHPHMIDLGLPSGTLWACCNVDATKPEDFGGYYAWGETWTKDVYNESTYKYAQKEGETYYYSFIGNDIAGTDYDVATIKWGKEWRMPTHEQMHELFSDCHFEPAILNGVKGRQYTGNNGGTLFIPAAGYKDNPTLGYGEIWTSTITTWSSNSAYSMYFDGKSYGGSLSGSGRCYGHNVRPVRKN